MSIDEVLPSPPYHRWCVNVALLSFRGEAWALTSGKGDCGDTSAESMDGSGGFSGMKQGEKARNGPRLHIFDGSFNNHGNKVEKSNSTSKFFDVVQRCNENTTLIKNIMDIEFVIETSTLPSISSEATGDNEVSVGNQTPMRYKLQSPLDQLIKDVLTPAVSVVVEGCLNAMVLVYGATQEMKQLGVVGTPKECGLLPYGICMVMDQCAERHERSHSNSSWSLAPSSAPEIPMNPTPGEQLPCATHRFVRAEASFIAFDAVNIVDLLDLKNRNAEIALHLGDSKQMTYRVESDQMHQDIKRAAVADAFVRNVRTLPAEHAIQALEALDIGLDNFTRAAEVGLLQSQAGASLLYSLTLFTDDRRSATFHLLCFAEDAVLQNWLVSSALTFSHSVQDVDEVSPTTMQNVSLPSPPPLQHNATLALAPLLCCGNIFASVLICAYNSVTAIRRLTRDLTFALAGSRMITSPYVTSLLSRRCQRPHPDGWDGCFTCDGREFYLEKSTQHTMSNDPHLDTKKGPGNGAGLNNEKNELRPRDLSTSVLEQKLTSVPMNSEDQPHLEEGLRRSRGVTSRVWESSSVDPPYTIVVIDAHEKEHVLLGPVSRKNTLGTVPVPVDPSEVLLSHSTLAP